MRALLLSLILILATAINCYASNSVYIKQTDQTGSSIFIKQDGSSNVVGVSSSVPLLIQGNNVDIIIKQIGNSNDAGADFDGNQPGFFGTNMTFDYQVTGNSNDLELDQSDINSTGHWYDIDITGSSNKLIFRSDASKDVDNTNVDLDVRGSSNYMKFYVMEDNHFLYVLVDGDSNIVKFKALDGATGFNTNANKAIGPNIESHGYLADYCRGKANIYSAGIEVHGVNEMAIEVMSEDGIDISMNSSNNIDEYISINFNYIITVCDHANENCPFIPSNNAIRIHQNFSDPSKSDLLGLERKENFILVRNKIKNFCRNFVNDNF